jgi:hypothetical protein
MPTPGEPGTSGSTLSVNAVMSASRSSSGLTPGVWMSSPIRHLQSVISNLSSLRMSESLVLISRQLGGAAHGANQQLLVPEDVAVVRVPTQHAVVASRQHGSFAASAVTSLHTHSTPNTLLLLLACPCFHRTPYNRKCAFDAGDYGLGFAANSLKLGCDCLGVVAYFDGVVNNAQVGFERWRRQLVDWQENARLPKRAPYADPLHCPRCRCLTGTARKGAVPVKQRHCGRCNGSEPSSSASQILGSNACSYDGSLQVEQHETTCYSTRSPLCVWCCCCCLFVCVARGRLWS